MKNGRPTIYNDELLDKAESYIENFAELGDVIPSIEGLSEYLPVARSTIYEWKDSGGKERFSDILARILTKQARLLMNSGLKGDFNAAITKLALGKHGYSDKLEQDVTSNGKDLSWTIEVVDAK